VKRFISLNGFRYLFLPKPLLGAYIAMENFAKGLLRYGTFDEYHTVLDFNAQNEVSSERLALVGQKYPRLKVRALQEFSPGEITPYDIFYCDYAVVDQQSILRRHLQPYSLPLIRPFYTIATNAHLRDLMNICLLEQGGRPYDALIFLSNASLGAIKSYLSDLESVHGITYRGHLTVIHPGIEAEEFAECPQLQARQKLNLPEKGIILLSNARLSDTSKMDYHRVITFFLQALTHFPHVDLYLLLAGSDPNKQMQSRIMSQLSGTPLINRIKFVTNYPDTIKRDIYQSADIFISLSDNLQESFGITVIEAMASRLPVIVTDWNGYKDIVDHGITGFRVPTAWDSAAVTEHEWLSVFRSAYDHGRIFEYAQKLQINLNAFLVYLEILINQKERRLEMANAGYQKFTSMFTLERQIINTEKLFHELMREAKADRTSYSDLSSHLYYNYLRHFASYPSSSDFTANFDF